MTRYEQHHQNNMDGYAKKIGLSLLKELTYRIAKGENTKKLADEFGISVHEVVYLMRQPEQAMIYVYEQEKQTSLRLISRSAA